MINQQKNQQNRQKNQQILTIMEAGIEYSTEQVAEKIGLKGPRTRQLLDELVNKELLTCIGITKRKDILSLWIKNFSLIIAKYEMLIDDGLTVKCMLIDDFKLMCKQLLSPIEIIEYLKWREAFYKKNENLGQQYLYEKYGENTIYEDRLYYELFRQAV